MNVSTNRLRQPDDRPTMNERYFLFTLQNLKLDNFIGPVFDHEINQYRQEGFEEDEQVEIMDEKLFRMLYSAEYLQDFYYNWSDYISYLLQSLELTVDIIGGGEEEDENEEKTEEEFQLEIDNDIVLIEGIGQICKDADKLRITLNMNANAHQVARVIVALTQYCSELFEVVIEPETYIDLYGARWTKEDAISAYEDDKLLRYFAN